MQILLTSVVLNDNFAFNVNYQDVYRSLNRNTCTFLSENVVSLQLNKHRLYMNILLWLLLYGNLFLFWTFPLEIIPNDTFLLWFTPHVQRMDLLCPNVTCKSDINSKKKLECMTLVNFFVVAACQKRIGRFLD